MKNKLIISIIAFALTISCNAQKSDTKNNMEKYNFELMDSKKQINPYGVIQNGRKIVMYHMGRSGTHYLEYQPTPIFYKVIKGFHPNGTLKVAGKEIAKNLLIGETIFYDEQGKVTKQINEDAKFGIIKADDLLRFIEREGHINLESGEGLENVEIDEEGRVQPIPSRFNIYLDVDTPNQYWVIVIIALPWNNWTETIYHLDKDTGEVLFKESEQKYPTM